MKVWLLLIAIALPVFARLEAADLGREKSVFRFSLTTEPTGVNPARIGSSESNYFLVNVLRGLYFIDAHGDAKPEIAKSCAAVSPLKVRCELKSGARWSDGKPIRAQDFVESWRRLLSPDAKGTGAELLRGVSGALAIHKGDAKAESLGVRAVSDRILEISLQEPDPEFQQRLAHPALVATRSGFSYDRDKAAKAPFSGPYRIREWKTGGRIRLETNGSYETIQKTGAVRPPVEILVLDDDETALNLYREGTLTFLRRLPVQYLKSWKDSRELHQIPMARFDYLGFGPALRDEDAFRHALSAALNYDELRVIYSALGVPGCPSIDPTWMDTVPCLRFDLKRAQEHWAKVPSALKEKRWTLHFSKLGGESIQTGMEWIQAQWKKHLGFSVELKSVEQQMYLSTLRTSPPDLFRKGVGLDRSTCLAAVEIFGKDDSENFIHLNRPEYETALTKLREAKSEDDRKRACTEAVRQLVDRAEIIPMGQIHFSILAKPSFKGWVLNPLNHLDLSHLQTVSTL